MKELYTISWIAFGMIGLILFILGIIIFRIKWGERIVKRYSSWDNNQWFFILIAVLLVSFILVNPLSHGIIIAIGGFLYTLYLKRGPEDNITDLSDPKRESPNVENAVVMILKNEDNLGLLEERRLIDKCLFSLPYLLHDIPPLVKYNGEEYEIILHLSSEKYLSSLCKYMTTSGFSLNIKTK